MSTPVIAFKCDFCGRIMKQKGSMTRHEKFCSNNPINKFKCFDCKFLEYKVQSTFDGDGEFVSNIKTFNCIKLNLKLHTHKAVQRNLANVLKTTELMKIKCSDFFVGTHASRYKGED